MMRQEPATSQIYSLVVCSACSMKRHIELSKSTEDRIFIQCADIMRCRGGKIRCCRMPQKRVNIRMSGFLRSMAPTNLLYGMAILPSPQKTPTGQRPYHDLHGMLVNNQKTADLIVTAATSFRPKIST